jgi:hypothetical protein
LSDEVLRIQSVLAIGSSDERPGFDQREYSSLGGAGSLDCAFSAVDKNLIKKFTDLGVDPRKTFEDAPTWRH